MVRMTKKTLTAVLAFGVMGTVLSIATLTNAGAQSDGPEGSHGDHTSYGYGACTACDCSSFSGVQSACSRGSCRHRFSQHRN